MAQKLFMYTSRLLARHYSSRLWPKTYNIVTFGNKGVVTRGIMLSAGLLAKTTDEEWRKKLTPQQYHVCRQKGTEPPWSGEYLDCKEKGLYQCVCCGANLFSQTTNINMCTRSFFKLSIFTFSSSTKFDSGSGWPSFYDTVKDKKGVANTKDIIDKGYGMVRVEVLCSKCDSHLGHVFNDGPPPTGLRYCINSLALKFKPE